MSQDIAAPRSAATSAKAAASVGSLELQNVSAGYSRTPVLRDVSLTVPKGTVVALLGANGAGKTTLLSTASGTLTPSKGRVLIEGTDVTGSPPHRRARRGLCLIPEGRGIFPALSVRDNLRMQTPPWSKDGNAVDRALAAFPDIGRRLGQIAGTMSGGQQQMLALCHAWIAKPQVVLLDEVSIGLAPTIVDQIFAALDRLAAEGVALLIVEQYVSRALAIAKHVYVLEKGEISFSGPPAQLDEKALLGSYLGTAQA